MLPALLAATALAAAPQWRWDIGKSNTYITDTCLALPEPLVLVGGARADLVRVESVLSCEPALSEPAGWTLVCTVRGLGLQAEARPGEEAGLAEALVTLDSTLTGVMLVQEVYRDGRQRPATLSGLDRRDRASSALGLMLLERGLLGLELALPSGPETRWGQPSPGLLSYLPRARSGGASRLQSEATPSEDGARWEIHSRGIGVLQAEALPVEGRRGAPAALSLNMTLEGSATLDLAEGAMVARSWTLTSTVTPTGEAALEGSRWPYAGAGTLRRLGAGEAVSVAESRPLAAGERPGACAALDTSAAGP